MVNMRITMIWITCLLLLVPSSSLIQGANLTINAQEEPGDDEPDNKIPDGYITDNKCFHWYSEGMMVQFWIPGKEGSSVIQEFEEKDMKPSTDPDIICGEKIDPKTGVRTTVIKVNFENAEKNAVALEWAFDVRVDGDWYLNEAKSKIDVSIPKKGQASFIPMNVMLEAANAFSFSCGDLIISTYRPKKEGEEEEADGYSMQLRMKRFQVQPFGKDVQRKIIFADSWDCSVWFTIPLIVGLVVTIFFIAIIYMAIYGLMSIQGPTKFEDPKGKTINVIASE